MARRTFEEKVKYNEANSKKSIFSSGYSTAVVLYESYIKAPKESRKLIQKEFDSARQQLKLGQEKLKRCEADFAKHKSKELYALQKYNAQQLIDHSKGMLSGMRDAANERKKRNNSFF